MKISNMNKMSQPTNIWTQFEKYIVSNLTLKAHYISLTTVIHL